MADHSSGTGVPALPTRTFLDGKGYIYGKRPFRHRGHKTKRHLLHMPTKFLLSAMRKQAQQIAPNLED